VNSSVTRIHILESNMDANVIAATASLPALMPRQTVIVLSAALVIFMNFAALEIVSLATSINKEPPDISRQWVSEYDYTGSTITCFKMNVLVVALA